MEKLGVKKEVAAFLGLDPKVAFEKLKTARYDDGVKRFGEMNPERHTPEAMLSEAIEEGADYANYLMMAEWGLDRMDESPAKRALASIIKMQSRTIKTMSEELFWVLNLMKGKVFIDGK